MMFTKRIALIVANSSGGDQLETLPNIDSDVNAVREGLIAIGFEDDEIIELRDRDNLDLDEDINMDQISRI